MLPPLILRTLQMMVVLTATIGFSASARANLVLNGNFSTGTFADWTLTGDTSQAYVTSDGTGNFVAALSTSSSQGLMSQTLSTVNGQIYTLSFIVASDGATPNSLAVSLGGSTLVSLTNVPSPSTNYTTYTADYTAVATTTALAFAFVDNPGYLYVTDISVDIAIDLVPEPSSIFGVGLGSLMIMGRTLRSRRRITRSRI